MATYHSFADIQYIRPPGSSPLLTLLLAQPTAVVDVWIFSCYGYVRELPIVSVFSLAPFHQKTWVEVNQISTVAQIVFVTFSAAGSRTSRKL